MTTIRRLNYLFKELKMANFDKAIEGTFKAEGGFQEDVNDSANYVNGKCIGTNRGISASAYYSHFKRVPTKDDMLNLTELQAKQIFKGNYWDKICGDFIKNQSVAELMFQFIIGSGASQLSDLKDIANIVNGKDVLKETDTTFTIQEINFINQLDQQKYHAAMIEWRLKWYDFVVSRSPNKEKFLKGWKNRLNTHKFKL